MIVVLAIGLALGIQAFLVKPYQIPSESMEPTLEQGQRILVNRITFHLGGDPEIGDVVVFHPPVTAEPDYEGEACSVQKPDGQACPENDPRESDENFVKRVVAGPGDQVRIENGIPIVNDQPVDEPDWDVQPCGSGDGCNLEREITIPEDHYFMMGDNRGFSDDSRYWGPVPRDWMIGEAFFTYWPIDRIGLL
ncbi:MAG TPA: signal peptidase I [Solirubrobacterales bacterium]|nr:signal peptidase I [Solirubrobacterales bacterium]